MDYENEKVLKLVFPDNYDGKLLKAELRIWVTCSATPTPASQNLSILPTRTTHKSLINYKIFPPRTAQQ